MAALTPFRIRLACILGLAGLLAGPGALALGKPDWAQPFLEQPPPQGAYIAKADDWVVLYAEVEFAISIDHRVEKRTRIILENRREKDLDLIATIALDDERHDLADVALNVQRTFWHTINLNRSAAEAREKGGGPRLVFTSAEAIAPKHRVVFEYTLRDKIGFFRWDPEEVKWNWPAAKVKYGLAPESAAAGMRLDLVVPSGQTVPASYRKQDDGSWVISEIPAYARVPDDLPFQPTFDSLYPYFLAVLPGDPQGTWDPFAKDYSMMWREKRAAMNAESVKQKAASLTKDLPSQGEKADRLARFVQSEVLYDDSNENGAQGWVPLAAEESLRSMKADCKGKVMLLQALLDAVAIPSEPVLVRSESDYYEWGSHPGTSFINHVIVAVNLPARGEPYPATLVEGPLKGWVLFDPTRRTSRFGEPPGGMEGFPVFAPCVPSGRFAIRTLHPAARTAEAEVICDFSDILGLGFKVREKDNGGGGFGSSLVGTYSTDDIQRSVLSWLTPVTSQVQVKRVSVARPAVDGVPMAALECEGNVHRALQEMASTDLLLSPLAIAAKVVGIPNGLTPRPPIPEDEKIVLASPWDARLNAQGEFREVNLSVRITLPKAYVWDPPKVAEGDKPWLKYRLEWKPDGPDAWKGTFSMTVPRGSWPAERKERLKAVDELYRTLYVPMILKKVP